MQIKPFQNARTNERRGIEVKSNCEYDFRCVCFSGEKKNILTTVSLIMANRQTHHAHTHFMFRGVRIETSVKKRDMLSSVQHWSNRNLPMHSIVLLTISYRSIQNQLLRNGCVGVKVKMMLFESDSAVSIWFDFRRNSCNIWNGNWKHKAYWSSGLMLPAR